MRVGGLLPVSACERERVHGLGDGEGCLLQDAEGIVVGGGHHHVPQPPGIRHQPVSCRRSTRGQEKDNEQYKERRAPHCEPVIRWFLSDDA